METASILNDSTMKVLDNSRLETAENIEPIKLQLENARTRPVSAYTHAKTAKVFDINFIFYNRDLQQDQLRQENIQISLQDLRQVLRKA